MDILFIGPYKQNDGWGHASLDYIRSLLQHTYDDTDNNIAVRPIYMSNNVLPQQLEENIQEAEKLQFNNKPDIIIQNTLPSFLSPTDSNDIGLCFFETQKVCNKRWIRNLNLMDMLWTHSENEKQALLRSGVKTPISVIHGAVDLKKYYRKYDDKNIQRYKLNTDTFKFYFVGEYTHRKNIIELILAFNREFHYREKVDLVIKTNRSGSKPNILHQKINEDVTKLHDSMRLYKDRKYYKRPIIITDMLTNFDLCALHQECDCFVTTSYGEAFCRPAIDGMGFGNTPICTGNTGMDEFVNNKTGWVIPSMVMPVLTHEPPIKDIYTSHETWVQPAIITLQKYMREAFELSKDDRTAKQDYGMEKIKEFSHQHVGQLMMESIGELQTC